MHILNAVVSFQIRMWSWVVLAQGFPQAGIKVLAGALVSPKGSTMAGSSSVAGLGEH